MKQDLKKKKINSSEGVSGAADAILFELLFVIHVSNEPKDSSNGQKK